MPACIVIHGEDGCRELLSVGLEILNVPCKLACRKGDKSSAELFVEGFATGVEGHELCHRETDALLGQTASDASKRVLAVPTCGEASSRGSAKKDLTSLDSDEQSVLLYIPGDVCETDVAHVDHVSDLCEESAAAH